MSFDVIRQIDEVERQAEKIVADAQTQAHDIVARTRIEADDLYKRETSDTKTKAANLVGQAQESRGRVLETYAQEAQQSCVKLEETAKSNIVKATALIIQKVVNG